MFVCEKESCRDDQVLRYHIESNGSRLTYADVLELWQNDHAFGDFFSGLIVDSPFCGLRWETPALTLATADREFEFVLVDAPGFTMRKADRRTFAKHFECAEPGESVVCFENLGKDAHLVVPLPLERDDVYSHLAAFLRGAPRSQVRALWSVLAQAVKNRLSDSPIWVSTAGGGVAWLHVRIDNRPKYYSFVEYRSS